VAALDNRQEPTMPTQMAATPYSVLLLQLVAAGVAMQLLVD
jgi:hypothetical protein